TLVVAMIGAGVAWTSKHQSVEVENTKTPVSSAMPAAVPSPAAMALGTNPSPTERSVRVAIEPADATVEADGKSANVVDGAITIVGELGSTHPVRVRKGEVETRVIVVISAAGAMPEKVTVDAPTQPTSSATDTSASRRPSSSKKTPSPSTAS